ncbi:MAG: helix-turn-helix transcriptional regulator [Alteraurantiacibacter sp.]
MFKGDDQDYQTVHALLRQVRKDAGMRQRDLAERLGIPQSVISKVETGERRLDIIETEEFCKAVGISLVDFVAMLAQKKSANE